MTAYNGYPVSSIPTYYNNNDWSTTIINNTTPTPSNVYNVSNYFGEIAPGFYVDWASSTPGANPTTYNSTHYTGVSADKAPTDGAGVGFDWFERIHVNPSTIAAGSIVADQTYTVELHNAFRSTQRTLDTAVNNVSADVTASTPPLPDVVEPLTSQVITITVDKDGVTSFDGTYDFSFDSGQTIAVTITGTRVVLLPWIALDGMTERLEWKTDILPAYSEEQRRGLRSTPRKTVSMDFLLKDNDRANFEGRAKGFSRQFLVPLWYDNTNVGAISSGATSVTVDTTDGEYQNGAYVFLYESVDNFEASRIDSVGASSVTLLDPIVNTYTSAYVVPAFIGYCTKARGARDPANYTKVSAEFSLVSHYSLPAPSTTQHRSIDVLLDETIDFSPVEADIYQNRGIIDNGIYSLKPFAKESRARAVHTQNWLKRTKSQRYAMKQWIYSRYGKRISFFYPTWQRDYTIIATVASGSTTMDVEYCEQEPNFDFMLELNDGTTFYRQVTDKLSISGGFRLTINASFGQEITVNSVKKISLMYLVRQASDSVNIDYSLPNTTRASVGVIET